MVPASQNKRATVRGFEYGYFQLVANGKHKKSRIYQLKDGDQVITSDADSKRHITSYYKNLFGPSEECTVSMDAIQRDDIPQVSDLENQMLMDMVTEEKVKRALFQMEHNKAPGPDGSSAEFYQTFLGLD